MKARIGICNDIDGIAWAVQSCKSLDEGKGDKSDASIVKRASINPTATTVQSWNSGLKQRTNDRCHLPLPPRHGITGLVASESQRSSLTRRRLPGVTRLLPGPLGPPLHSSPGILSSTGRRRSEWKCQDMKSDVTATIWMIIHRREPKLYICRARRTPLDTCQCFSSKLKEPPLIPRPTASDAIRLPLSHENR